MSEQADEPNDRILRRTQWMVRVVDENGDADDDEQSDEEEDEEEMHDCDREYRHDCARCNGLSPGDVGTW